MIGFIHKNKNRACCHVNIDKDKKLIKLSKILSWYEGDFVMFYNKVKRNDAVIFDERDIVYKLKEIVDNVFENSDEYNVALMYIIGLLIKFEDLYLISHFVHIHNQMYIVYYNNSILNTELMSNSRHFFAQIRIEKEIAFDIKK